MHSADDLHICLGDINGHIGRHIDGLYEGHGVGQRNFKGKMTLEFCPEKEICAKYMFKRAKK